MILVTDVYDNTSEELSSIILKVLDDEDIAQPATLLSVREEILKDIKTVTIPVNSFSDGELQELRNEIDSLIDEYGDDALAIRFLKPRASESLSLLIEAAMDNSGEVTLSKVFNEIEQGLLARLIGEGELDDDEAQTVVAELESLIDKHGRNAIAEEFLRYL